MQALGGKGTGPPVAASGSGGPSQPTSSQGQELTIDVPSLSGQLEAWQFGLLLDVINDTLAAPLPQVRRTHPPTALVDRAGRNSACAG